MTNNGLAFHARDNGPQSNGIDSTTRACPSVKTHFNAKKKVASPP